MYQCALTALLTAQRKMSTAKRQNIAQKKFSLTGGKDDPSKWGQVRMIRENNKKEFKGPEEDMPKVPFIYYVSTKFFTETFFVVVFDRDFTS